MKYIFLVVVLFTSALSNADEYDCRVNVKLRLNRAIEILSGKIADHHEAGRTGNMSGSGAYASRNLQSGGIVYVDEDGSNYIISANSNFRFSGQVDIELLEDGHSGKIIYDCPVVYADRKSGLSVIRFPDGGRIFASGIESHPELVNSLSELTADDIGKAIAAAREIRKTAAGTGTLKQQLINNCLILSSEVSSEYPDYGNISAFVSADFIIEQGWASYLNLVELSSEESELRRKQFRDAPLKLMQYAISYFIVSTVRKNTGSIRYESINFADIGSIGSSNNIRTNFVFTGGNLEVVWTYVYGNWYIKKMNLDLKDLEAGISADITDNQEKRIMTAFGLGFESSTGYNLVYVPGDYTGNGIIQYASAYGDILFDSGASFGAGLYYGLGYCISVDFINGYSYLGDITLQSSYVAAQLGMRLFFESGWFMELGLTPKWIFASEYKDGFGSGKLQIDDFSVIFPIQLSGGYEWNLKGKIRYQLGLGLKYTPADNLTFPFELLIVQRLKSVL